MAEIKTILTYEETTELLDWVSACQSAYHINSTPNHPFGDNGSTLAENREGLIEYVNSILSEHVESAVLAAITPTVQVDAVKTLDLFEDEQQRVLMLDPRKRAMQHNYSVAMTVCYKFRQFIQELNAAPSPAQTIEVKK